MSQNKEELGKKLLGSYRTLLERNSLVPEDGLDELEQLSKYSHSFSSVWFTTEFVEYLVNKMDKAISCKHKEAVGYTTLILKRWVHILLETTVLDSNEKQQKLMIVVQLLIKTLYIEDNTWISPVQDDAWRALVDLIGRGVYPDTKLLNAIADIIETYAKDMERVKKASSIINAAVGHSLSKTTALDEMHSCQRLLLAYIHYVGPMSEGIHAIMQALEYSIDIRSQQKKPQAQVQTDLSALTQISINVAQHGGSHHHQSSFKMPSKCLARLAGLAGVVRALQFNSNPSRVFYIKKEAEHVFLQQLNMAVNMSMSLEHIYQLETNQSAIALFSGRCLIKIPDKHLKKEMNLNNLAKVICATLLDSKYTFQGGDIIHSLINTTSMLKQADVLVNHILFKDIGRISRVLSKLIIILYTQKEYTLIGHLLNRWSGFSYNIFVDWDRFIVDHSGISMDSEESKNYTELTTLIWDVLKSILFSSIVLLQAVTIDLSHFSGLMNIPQAPQNVLSTLANLSFISEQLRQGLTSRNIYEKILMSTVAFLLYDDNNEVLNEMVGQAFKEYAPMLFIHDKQESIDILSMVKQSRLLFYTDICEQVMYKIDNGVIEKDILPVLYPILSWRRIENKNLYESAHAAVISIFTSEKPICNGLAGIYAAILIQNFPQPITLNQLRYAYKTLIQALCRIDESLAWVTTNQLITKLDTIKLNNELIVIHSQYIIVLIDLLKPLSITPFFTIMLGHVQRMILTQPTKGIQKATMRMLFETISSFDISNTRKTEAIGWYLALKNKIQ